MQVLAPVSIILLIIYNNYKYKNKMPYYVFTSLVFALVAFSFQPGKDDDLLREFAQLEAIRTQGWSYFSTFTSNIAGEFYSNRFQGLIVTQIYYFIMAHMPLKNFLPAITLFIEYLLQLKILDKIQKRFNLSKKDIVFLFIFVICTRETYNMMSGIRNYLAFTIFGYALYTDLVEKKNRLLCFLIYVGMALMHQSGWILFAIRILCLIPWKRLRSIMCIAALFWGNFTSAFQKIIARYSSIPLLNSLYVKIYNFTDPSSSYSSLFSMTPRYFLYMISNIGIVVLAIWVYRAYIKYNNGELVGSASLIDFDRIKIRKGKIYISRHPLLKDQNLNQFYDIFYYVILALCIMFGALPYRIIFSRIGIILRVLEIIPAGIMLKFFSDNKMFGKKKTLRNLIIIASIIKFLIMMIFCNRSMNFNLFGWYYF